MIRKRNFGSLVAIGGTTAVMALLTGLSGASADELSDLRANQQLLQQRIDQLAQAQAQQPPAPGGVSGGGPGSAYGTKPISGQSIAGGSFPRSFLIPGTDTSIRVGGFVDITALDFLQGGGAIPGSNNSSNSGQNGNLHSIPVGEAFIPGAGKTGIVPQAANASKGNGVFTFSPQQTRFNVETRTPTAWGESRTFFEFDWSGCNSFSCQSLQQGGGNSMVPRLRYAYGTLGGFLAGQAISNFSDADADTESLEFGGTMGSTGGYRVPQVRYTLAGPYGSAFSIAAEQPFTSVALPGGPMSSDLATSGTGSTTSPTSPLVPTGSLCNGVPCVGTGAALNATVAQTNPAKQTAPTLTIASYWS
ncbi:MAG TPA: DcaP family trimeric outer membrane transporter, partial [Stellaceae bacterium]|nr:DcaP family trimeric outer membrane transporter [Stellaceae bacterium]